MDVWTGLTDSEAAKKFREEGPNILSSEKKLRIFSLAAETLRDPIFLLLATSGAIYFMLGDLQESLMLMGFVVFIMMISLFQEIRTGRALDALKNLSSPRALVIRDGKRKRVSGQEIVRGDILVLSEGDRVPADAALLWNSNLLTDESLLTGESAAVRKSVWDRKIKWSRPGGEDRPFVYSGTLIVGGSGIAETLATGDHTAIGQIGKSLRAVKPEPTPLQKETKKLVRRLAFWAVGISALTVLGYGALHRHWLDGILAGITLAMAILPNEFPVVLTIFLALGAWRIAKKNVLTRRIPAVETLGSITVLCVDKTGTLTYNKMALSKIYSQGKLYSISKLSELSLPEPFHRMIEYGILASVPDPFDPMDKAIKLFGETALAGTEHLHKDWQLVREYPISRELLALSNVWQSQEDQDGEKKFKIAAKGAPEAIAHLCGLKGKIFETVETQANQLAEAGFRLIAVAESNLSEPNLPETQQEFSYEFLGLLAFEDPVRAGVVESIQKCKSAGIRVVMMTGDYVRTAQSIAKQIGLPEKICLTGSEIESMSDSELAERISNVQVFARVMPEQKLRLVNALKANGEIVAMTGDGVNDAPALKAAHLGIAMGLRGTDVAREAGSLVLLDDDFSSIVESVQLGRRIFDNLKKALAYLLAIHVPIAGLCLLPAIFAWPLILMPIHIAFLHLIIDPACSIVFEQEPEEVGLMTRSPRKTNELVPTEKPLFGKSTIILSLLQGCGVFLMVAAIFAAAIHCHCSTANARALAFTTLMIANLSLILTNRSWSRSLFSSIKSKNHVFWMVLISAIIFLTLILRVPFLRHLFQFSALTPLEILFCIAANIAGIFWFELLKIFYTKKREL